MFSFKQESITDSLNIFIKTNTGTAVSVNLDRTWDIEEVKQNVAPHLGLRPKEFKIIFAGKELKDSIILSVSIKKI